MVNLQHERQKRRRTYRLRRIMDDATFSEEDIRQRFRFRRESILFLANLLRDDLMRPTQKNHALSVETQVLISLRFLATGSFQQVIGDVVGVDKSLVSRVVPKFCEALNSKKNQFIKFPRTIEEKIKMAGFPSVVGYIDCTHVRITGPRENERDFVNRKNFHSINVQAISDHKNRFIDVN